MNALIYDIEIVKVIPLPNMFLDPDIQYCSGWGDRENMGVSVICAYDYAESQYRVFLEDNFDQFLLLGAQRDLLVSWNGLVFDDKVIEACIGPMPSTPRYDLLAELKTAGAKIRLGGSLDAFSWRNTGLRKNGDGALAPVLWQRGMRGQVIDYCLNDVRMTKGLFDMVRTHGSIASPNGGLLVRPRDPRELAAAGQENP